MANRFNYSQCYYWHNIIDADIPKDEDCTRYSSNKRGKQVSKKQNKDHLSRTHTVRNYYKKNSK